ncbi:hypothetical protein LC55x_1762 [Lysobacter capsici]|nr:hypothetical protein LC55x_1762 [Lysobacter capsici]
MTRPWALGGHDRWQGPVAGAMDAIVDAIMLERGRGRAMSE